MLKQWAKNRAFSRSPRGERGLKLAIIQGLQEMGAEVAPLAGSAG